MSSDPAPCTALTELVERRAAAQARVDELEAEQRRATEAVAEASGLLADLERRIIGGEKVTPATRREAEAALASARVEAGQPWAERLAGARATVRDAHQRLQGFTAEHLDELVGDLEGDGEVAAANLNAAAEALVAAFLERERIAGAISTLVSSVARIHPGDVSYTLAEQAVRAATELIESGGEAAPVLRRDPREPRHGVLDEAVPAA